MREFKFIRGIYKNEKVLSQDETKDTLFALYKNGSPVLLDTVNDEDFQKTIVGLESDNREIYTIRPSQFTVSAKKQNKGDYSFEYVLDGLVYDNSGKFPDVVKNAAATHLSTHTIASIRSTPSLIPPDSSGDKTPVDFTYNNGPHFERDLYFKVSGQMKTFTRVTAEKTVETAYKITGDTVDYDDRVHNGTFLNGRLQQLIRPTNRDIAPAEVRNVNNENYTNLEVASKYYSGEGFMFVRNNRLQNNAPYSNPLDFDLYRRVTVYLREANIGNALNNGKLKDNYVAYRKEHRPEACYCENGTIDKYEFSTKNCVQANEDTSIYDWTDYVFYEKITSGSAYVLEGNCVAQEIGTTLVKDYIDSLSNLFIIDNQTQGLVALQNDILTPGRSISVYESGDYNVIEGSAYINNPENDNSYVTLSDERSEDFTKDNIRINGETVLPVQDSTTFRQIKNIYINATES